MCYLIVCVFSDASCIFFCAFRDLFTLLKCYIALCIFMLFILSFLLQIVSVNALYFVIQTQWAPIADDNQTCTTVSSSPDIQPDVNNTTPTLTTDASTSCPSVSTTPRCVPTPVRHRPNPLPVFEWADSRQMWEMMMVKYDELRFAWAPIRVGRQCSNNQFRRWLSSWKRSKLRVYSLRRCKMYCAWTIDFYIKI